MANIFINIPKEYLTVPTSGDLPSGVAPGTLASVEDGTAYVYDGSTWFALGGGSPVIGTPNSFAGFDGLGAIGSISGFQIDTTTSGMSVNLTELPNNGGGFTVHTITTNFDPQQNSPAENWNVINLFVQMDVNSSGFTQGTNGNAVQLINMGFSHAGTGDTGALININASNTLGNGTDPITIKGVGVMAASSNIQSGVTIDGQMYGYSFNPTMQLGSISGSSQNLQAFWDGSQILVPENTHTSFLGTPSINEIQNNNNYNGVQIGPNITTLTGNASANGFLFAPTITTTSTSGGVVGLQTNPVITTMGSTSYYHGIDIYGVITTSHGNINGINISPTINGGDANFYGISIAPNGTANLPVLTGITVNLSSFASSAQKQGLAINDGALQVISNYNTSVLPASPGFASLNQLTGQLTVASGSPMSTTLVFANQLSVNALFQDDMGPDAFGGFGGFTNLGLASQISVASGKTVDTINSIVAAYSVPSVVGDGGTVTNATMYLAGGVFPGGGNLTVDNLYGLKILPGFASLATNAWGLHLADTTINHYVAGQIQLGGSSFSDLSANAVLKLEEGHLSSKQATAPTYTLDANAGTGATASINLGTDLAGEVQLDCGTTCSTGLQITVTFNKTYGSAPHVIMTPVNADSGINAVQYYVVSSTTDFKIYFNVASADSITYKWSYHVIETE